MAVYRRRQWNRFENEQKYVGIAFLKALIAVLCFFFFSFIISKTEYQSMKKIMLDLIDFIYSILLTTWSPCISRSSEYECDATYDFQVRECFKVFVMSYFYCYWKNWSAYVNCESAQQFFSLLCVLFTWSAYEFCFCINGSSLVAVEIWFHFSLRFRNSDRFIIVHAQYVTQWCVFFSHWRCRFFSFISWELINGLKEKGAIFWHWCLIFDALRPDRSENCDFLLAIGSTKRAQRTWTKPAKAYGQFSIQPSG